MRSLPTELPAAASRPVPTRAHDFDWDAAAHRVAHAEDRRTVVATVATAADALGVAPPAADAPMVVLQRVFGHLHRTASRSAA